MTCQVTGGPYHDHWPAPVVVASGLHRRDDARVARRSWWGWGTDTGGLTGGERQALGDLLGERFGLDGRCQWPPAVQDLALPAPRVAAPATLASIASVDPEDRAGHSLGKSYRDVVRALRGALDHPPDMVFRPRSAVEVADVLHWCSVSEVAAIPYGGGSSVVGGVEPDVGAGYRGAVSVDLGNLDRVLEVDTVSLAARIQAGVLGPSLEQQLRPAGLTLRHFPQSFEFSTLGGWIATRAGGHFATGPTHIDDLVEALQVVTPVGTVETRRLPASGAGPSPDRLFLGSEGALGIVTEAWVRVRPRPRWRSGGSCGFARFADGVEAVRALAQSGLLPSNCRLLDPLEAAINGAGTGDESVLLVGFESADHPVDQAAARAAELVADHGGRLHGQWGAIAIEDRSGPGPAMTSSSGSRLLSGSPPPSQSSSLLPPPASPPRQGSAGSTGQWRAAFMRAPYRRDALVQLGVLCETLETATTWDQLPDLHRSVSHAVTDALVEIGAGAGWVTCRLTHAYPDGAAPYFTVLAPARRGEELQQWSVVKAAASEAILAAGGTITHHHAVGRDHQSWYSRQRPRLFGEVLSAVKDILDPAGVCNPGVLVEPRGGG